MSTSDGATDAEVLIPLMDTSMDSSWGGHYGWALEKQDFNFPRRACLGGWRAPSQLAGGVAPGSMSMTPGLLRVMLWVTPLPGGSRDAAVAVLRKG